MTATYTAALAAIQARRELIEGGTAGPWFAVAADPSFNPSIGTVEAPDASMLRTTEWVAEVGPNREADAALIVAAVNAFASDTDALAAVLDRNAPEPEQVELMLHMHTPCKVCDDGGHLMTVCKGCFPSYEGMDGHTVWPCPDALTAMSALGVIEP